MKIRDHIDKIALSALDKGLFILYGFVTMLQIRHLDPVEAGLYALLVNIHIWISMISESSALQAIIQFGMNKAERKKINLISLSMHLCIMIGSGIIIALFSNLLATIFKEPRIAQVALILPLLNIAAIPRTFCLKFFYREINFKRVFLSNLSWLGGMSVITAYLLFTQSHLTFSDMLIVNIGGTSFSSLVTLILAWEFLEFSKKGSTKFKDIFKFGMSLTGAGSLHNIPRQLDIYIIQYFTNAAAVGVYFTAKTLFRFFDAINDAATALTYPALVRKVHNGNKEEALALISKAISAVFIFILAGVIAIELGGGALVINLFLPNQKYITAISQFNLMTLAALGMPFMLFANLMVASGDINQLLKSTFIATLLSVFSFITLGVFNKLELAPIGLIVYSATYGGLSLAYAVKKYGFQMRTLTGSLIDLKHLILQILGKQKVNG